MNLTWTEEEKLRLLEALQIHGVHDFELLAECVGSKTVADVKYSIYLYESAAMESLREIPSTRTSRRAPIDKWLNFFKTVSPTNYASKDIVTTFRIFAMYEEYCKSDVNLNECYEYIADLMSGWAPKSLDKETEKFILFCIVKLSEAINEQDSEEINFVNNLKYKDIFNKFQAHNEKESSVILDPSVNILNVPEMFLKFKKNI